MTDVRPDENRSGSHNGSGLPDGASDPLRGLYKMSRTAGLGSQDYVAINGLSVAAFLLGLASLLALIGTALLIIPLAAVVCAVIALRQIGSSNGTQTGRWAAIGGLVLALVFGGMQITQLLQQHSRERADGQRLNQLIGELGASVKAREYDKAYAMFSDRFAQRISKAEFSLKWKPLEDSPLLGALKGIEGNDAFLFETDPASDMRYAQTMLVVTFEKAAPTRLGVLFRHTGDNWVIENIPDLFPTQQPGGPGMPPMPGGAPPTGAM